MRGLLLGRFQPFHRGHLGVAQGIVAGSPSTRLILGIGSAQESHTFENPFTAGERFEMIDRALREAGLDRVAIVPIPDIQRHSVWVAHVESIVPSFDRVYTNNPLTRYLFERAHYTVESVAWVDREHLEGARIRAEMAKGEEWKSALPPAVVGYLDEIGAAARLSMLASNDARKAGGPPRAR